MYDLRLHEYRSLINLVSNRFTAVPAIIEISSHLAHDNTLLQRIGSFSRKQPPNEHGITPKLTTQQVLEHSPTDAVRLAAFIEREQ